MFVFKGPPESPALARRVGQRNKDGLAWVLRRSIHLSNSQLVYSPNSPSFLVVLSFTFPLAFPVQYLPPHPTRRPDTTAVRVYAFWLGDDAGVRQLLEGLRSATPLCTKIRYEEAPPSRKLLRSEMRSEEERDH